MARVSIPKKMIYYYLSQHFKDIQEQYRPTFLKGKEIDIYTPSTQIGIEYDGYRLHKDVEKDIAKDNICQEHGITIIRVREPKCPIIRNGQYCIITPKTTNNGTHMTQPIREIIDILNNDFKCNIDLDIDCCKDNADICKRIISTVGFNSLEHLYPEIAREWDYTKNYPLTPNKVPAHTRKKAWWVCSKCHKSYSSVISSRTGKEKCGCPDCRYTKAYKKVKYIELNRIFNSVNDAADFVSKKACSITSACKGYVQTCSGISLRIHKGRRA